MTTIIYLIGRPGVGKYTIAKEIAKSDYRICDNQLINNPIFELLGYDGFAEIPEFAWDVIGNIRNNVFDFITKETDNNYVLTNCLFEEEGDRALFDQVKEMAVNRGSLFVPVKLLISKEEHLKRITDVSRSLRHKSRDPKDMYNGGELLHISHPDLLELDVTELSPQQAVQKIFSHAAKIKL